MRKNRKCICCSTQYTYCPDCGGVDKMKPTWYTEFCCEDCKDLWLTATKYNMQLLTKEEAAKIISGLALKDKSEYVDCVQRDLTNIFAEAPKIKAPKATKTHAVVNTTKE